MRIMNARNFRSAFPTLAEPVMVISRERIVGTWSPLTVSPEMTRDQIAAEIAIANPEPPLPGGVYEIRTAKTQQANRDAILRKINKH